MFSSKRHKHVVAAPLFALMLMGTHFLSTSLPVSASVLRSGGALVLASEEERVVSLASGTAIRMSRGSEVLLDSDGASLTLKRGSFTWNTPSVIVIQTSQGVIRALASAGVASVQDSALTIALVRGQGLFMQANGDMLILSQGYQTILDASSVRTQPLPDAWIHLTTASLPSPSDVQAPMTLEMQDALLTQSQAELLGLLSGASEEAIDVSKALLESGIPPSEILSGITRSVLGRIKPVSPLLIEFWGHHFAREAAKDSLKAGELLSSALHIPHVMEERGYPLQAEFWRGVLENAIDVVSLLSPATDANGLEEARVMIRDIRLPAEKSHLSVPQESEIPLDHEELLLKAEATVRASDGLVASSTSFEIDPTRVNAVKIQNLFFSEDGEDVSYSFTYLVTQKAIIDVVRAGVLLPNRLSEEVFFQRP